MAEIEAPAAEAEVPAETLPGAAAEKPAEEPKARVYTQEEMDRITAKVKKNAAYRARKEAEAYYKGLNQGASLGKPAEAPKPQEEKEPVRGDFDSYEEFLAAKAAHVGTKAAREDRAKSEAESKARAAAEASAKAFETFQAKTREKFPDLEDRLESIGHIVMPEGMGPAITRSPLGPDILDHFARNPKDCERIAALESSDAIREIGKLEARLEGAKPADKTATDSKPPIKPASKAPDPIKPGGGAAAVDDTPKDSDPIDDWMRKERARERKKHS